MNIKSLPQRLLSAFRRQDYPLGGLAMSQWQIPPGLDYQSYLSAYGQVGWLFGAVSIISNSVADTEWHLYVNRGRGNSEEIDDHVLLDLLDHVNPFQTRYQFIQMAQTYLSLVGECFIVLQYNNLGVPAAMWLAPPQNMVVVKGDNKTYFSHYEYVIGNQRIRFEIPQIIHIKDPNPVNPLRGMAATQSIGVDLTAEQYAARYNQRFFYNDARPGLIIEIPGEDPGDDQKKQLYESWDRRFRGWGNSFKMAMLFGGAKANTITLSNKDMDFANLRKYNKDIILAANHIPQSLMGASEVGSRARAEADEYIFAKYTIQPALRHFKEAFNEQLCPLFDEKLFLDFDSPVPQDRLSLVDEVQKMTAAGIYTREYSQDLLGTSADDMKDGTYLMPFSVIEQPAGQKPQPRQLPPAADEGDDEEEEDDTKSKKKDFSGEQKESLWKQYILRTERQEINFKKTFKRLLDKQESEVIANYRENLNATFNPDINDEQFRKGFEPVIRETVAQSMEDNHVKQDEFLSPQAIDWIKTRSLQLAKLVNGTTKEQLRAALEEGYRNGESIDEIVARIKGYYKDGYERRAPILARTEIIAASNEGALDAYADANVKTVEWYTALDERTCEECNAVNNQIFTVIESHGKIPLHPQCRCTWIPVIS